MLYPGRKNTKYVLIAVSMCIELPLLKLIYNSRYEKHFIIMIDEVVHRHACATVSTRDKYSEYSLFLTELTT